VAYFEHFKMKTSGYGPQLESHLLVVYCEVYVCVILFLLSAIRMLCHPQVTGVLRLRMIYELSKRKVAD